jgi:hypothetical protein
LVRFAGGLWELERRSRALSRLGEGGCMETHHGLYGASPAASMAPNPTMNTKNVLMSIVDPFGVSRKSIHS